MSLVRLNIKSRIELETRVLAAALKQSFERKDAQGVSLAHRQLFLLLKDAGRSDESGVATVHFSDGVPPGLPVASGVGGADVEQGDAVEAAGSADNGPDKAAYAGVMDPDGSDEPAMRVGTIDPLFSLPSSVDERSTVSYAANAESGDFSQPGGRMWDESTAGSEASAQEQPSSRADTVDLSEIAAAQPGSLAARLYAEPLFGEHKPSAGPPPADRTTQKTTLDRLPASRVTPDADIEDSSIGELGDKQTGSAGTGESIEDARRFSQRVEESASSLAARALNMSSGRDSSEAGDDQSGTEPPEIFGPADNFFPHQAPPAALTPEAALAQLAQSGYGASVASSYQVTNTAYQYGVDQSRDQAKDDSGGEDDDAFSNPGGIVDAPFVVTEGDHPLEASQPEVVLTDTLVSDAARHLIEESAPNTVSQPESQTFAPTAPKPAAAERSGLDLLQESAPRPRAKKEVSAKAQPVAAQEAPAEEPSEPRRLDVYMLLAVSQMSPFEEIHRNFLRKVRRLLREIKGNKAERYPKLAELQRLWIAHDILTDPVTRTDYDFRDMGLRGSPDSIVSHAPEDQQQARLHNRTPLRIGELLQCAGLLETAELEIACDMHKAMPEMQFGTFLVRQGFIHERDLDSVLLGQKLLRDGAITVAQFQVAMELSQSRGTAINETLIEKGYISEADLESVITTPAVDTTAPSQVQIREISVLPKVDNENAETKAPTWRDQLDWGQSDSKSGAEDDQQVSGGLGGLLRAQTPAVPKAEGAGAVERVMKISKPDTPAEAQAPAEMKNAHLDAKNAVPSWKDQLDWASADSPPEPATNISQSVPPAREQAPAPALRVSNAVPTWKDQLDWTSPSDEIEKPGEEPVGVSTSENQPWQADRDLEFAPGGESSDQLHQAAHETAKDHEAVELDMHRPLRIKGETTYEELPTMDLDNDMNAATMVDPDAFAASDAETANFPASVSDVVRAVASTSAEDADSEEEEGPADSAAQAGRRDKKKKGKEKRKKKR